MRQARSQGPVALPALSERRRVLGWGLGLGASLPFAMSAQARDSAAALHWHEAATLALGTTVSVRVGHAAAEQAQRAAAAAMSAVAEVDAALSLFRADSALARLNRERELATPPPALIHALRWAQRAWRASGGRFDPSVQPLWRTWFETAQQGRQPTASEVARGRALLGFEQLALDAQHLRLPAPGMALTLNGIAQGVAADAARQALRQHGIQHALVDTGEWVAMGSAPRAPMPGAPVGDASARSAAGDAWRLGIAAPAQQDNPVPSALLATLLADGRAVACSADDKLSFTPDRREHHVLDPRTGHSPRVLAMVVVAAPWAAWADAMTKPLMMGTAAQALAWARRVGVDVLVVDKAGRWQASAGMRLVR